MSPITTQLGLLTLAASAVVAAPGHHGHHHYHSGRPFRPSGSGAPYGFGNGTGPYGTGSSFANGTAAPTLVSDVASATAGPNTLTQTVTSYAYITAASPSTDVAAVGDDTCSSAATVTLTNTVTVTATSSGGLTFSAVNHWHQHSQAPASSSDATSSVVEATSTTVEAAASSSSEVAPVETTSSSSTSTLAAYSSSATVSSSSSSSATAAATDSAIATGGKRGCAYNIASYCDAIASDDLAWSYNWASINGDWGFATSDVNSTLNYVPMLKDTTSASTASWTTDAAAAIASGATHLFSFNEPDIDSEANMSPAAAVTAFNTYMMPYKDQAKLGAPAVSNAPDSAQGLGWLAEFLAACADCQIDFIPIHWYDNAEAGFANFEAHVTQAIGQFITAGNLTGGSTAKLTSGAQLWITEFGLTNSDNSDACADQSSTDTVDFMNQALPFLDNNTSVERYSYFMADPSCLLNSAADGVSAAGAVYVSASS